jgi:hypothetical protein
MRKSGIRRKRRKNIGGRKAGKDHARSQCPEKRPGTQGCLRQEARPTSSGSDDAAQEATQVNRQRSSVLEMEQLQVLSSKLQCAKKAKKETSSHA